MCSCWRVVSVLFILVIGVVLLFGAGVGQLPGNTDNFKHDTVRHILRCKMLLATNGTLTCKLTEND